MIAKLIPTRIHGVLDYLTGLTLIAIPLLFNWPQLEAMIFMVLGAGALVYSLITRYELGVFKLLPMPAHLVLDLLSGLFLVAAPFLGLVADNLRPWFWAFGALEIVVALITSTQPHFAEDDYGAGMGAGYDKDVAMTGRNTTLAEGDQDSRYGVTNSTYTGSTRTATADQQTLPDDAGWTTANRSTGMGAAGETQETREDMERAERNRQSLNK